MTGDAAGMMIVKMILESDARKERAISFSEAGVLSTAPAVFSTITGMAMMQTTNTFDVSPIP